MYVPAYVPAYVHIYLCVCAYMQPHVHYMHSYIHTRTNAYAHTRTYVRTQFFSCLSSTQANNNDRDGGVLQGQWQSPYVGGRSPTSWNGSVAILKEYMAYRRSVKFGQCWVFSGLLTTCQ